MKQNKVFLIVLMLIWTSILSAQIAEPVKWDVKINKTSVSVGDELELTFSASIDDGWHLYSTQLPENGPISTSFNFEDSKGIEVLGKPVADKDPITTFDNSFQMDLEFFEHDVSFVQKVKVVGSEVLVKGYAEFMACDDERCIPPAEHDFEFKIDVAEAKDIVKSEPGQAKTDPAKNKTKNINKETGNEVIPAGMEEKSEVESTLLVSSQDAEGQESANKKKDASLWGFFWLAFLGGLAAIFTPCVFPMIPMTMSFFLKGSENKAKGRFNAIFYGLSIIGIYTVVGTVFALAFGANFANFLSTHWLPNILFFVIFLVFAASFFGAFEITMPSWIINKSTANEDKGGLAGVFFMATTLVLVSFSCTGPIVGAILVASAGGEILTPIIGMLGFSLAFALPFTVFALFPRIMTNMPKSGGWLNTVKVVLGFIEVALGLKFLSIADQTYHWGLLDREVYLAIWIVVFALMGFYLLGKIRFAHDSDVNHLSIGRLSLAIITFSFVVYLIPGMFGAPLKALSGYLPPSTTQDFDITRVVQEKAGAAVHEGDDVTELCDKPKYSDFLHLPHGLKGYFDYEQALACAKEQGKPLFIDFTGHGCVNCREMESRVWSDPKVLKKLKEDFVLVALYVDDKKKLPEEDWVTSSFDGKVKKTVGKKYADFQISRFKVNSQPYYVILDGDENMLVDPKTYDLDVDNFIDFLDEGLRKYK